MSDSADHDHKISSNADASFRCPDCGQEFKEHSFAFESYSN